MTTFDLKAEYMRVMEQYKLTHPRPVASDKNDSHAIMRCERCGWEGDRAQLLDGESCPKCKLVGELVETSYWDEKKKDRREEFKREDAENAERAYPDREWEHK